MNSNPASCPFIGGRADYHRSFDDVGQFADISEPVVACEFGQASSDIRLMPLLDSRAKRWMKY